MFLAGAGAGALAWLGLGCGNGMKQRGGASVGDGGRGAGGTTGAAKVDAGTTAVAQATPDCDETEDNIEGPYYRDGAPHRTDLLDAGMSGTKLVVAGTVLGIDGASCAALGGAQLDVWQANDEGRYDNDGSFGRPRKDRYMLRGKMETDAKGNFTFRTIIPGRYLNGAQYRPSHIHVKLLADGFEPLTTQLYFPGDPYNDIDPFIKASLVMNVTDVSDHKDARYDFVLRPKT